MADHVKCPNCGNTAFRIHEVRLPNTSVRHLECVKCDRFYGLLIKNGKVELERLDGD